MAFAARAEVSDISGANPMAVVNADPKPLANVGGVAPLTFGYFDDAGRGYAIVFSGVLSSAGPRALPGVKQITHVLPMAMSPWSSLKAHPKFALD